MTFYTQSNMYAPPPPPYSATAPPTMPYNPNPQSGYAPPPGMAQPPMYPGQGQPQPYAPQQYSQQPYQQVTAQARCVVTMHPFQLQFEYIGLFVQLVRQHQHASMYPWDAN